MKSSKSFKSNRSKPFSRSSAPAGKPRRSDDDAPRRPGDARPRHSDKPKVRSRDEAKSDRGPERASSSRFGEAKSKPRFNDDAKPRRFSDDKTRSRDDAKPRRFSDDKPRSRDDAKPRRFSDDRAKPRFNDDAKPRRFSDDKPKSRFSDDSKPRHYDARPRRFDEAKTAKPRFKDGSKPVRTYDEDKTKPAYKAGLKPGFRGGAKAKPFARTTARPLTREEYTPTVNTTLIWGLHAVRAAWLNPQRKIHRVWLTETGQKALEATQTTARDELLLKRPDAKKMERDELDRIVPPGSVHQGLVIEVAPLSEPSLHDIIGANPPPDLILLLDQVTDPHNVGAILRSAAAFGAGAIVMTERNAPNTTGVLAKSASGALEHTPMVHVVNLARTLDDLREAGYWCVGLAEEGEKTLGEMDLSGRTVLVLGNEGEGLRHLTRLKCDQLARLPTGGPIASLNVSNAAAVALYEVRRQGK
jgi:23S rRNA (guanosine2251-2'-O)-methyltransferase